MKGEVARRISQPIYRVLLVGVYSKIASIEKDSDK